MLDSLILKGRFYDVLKWLTVIVFPGLGTLYQVLAEIWGWGYADQVARTDVAVCAFLGLVLGLSSLNYRSSDARFDGVAYVDRLDPTNNPDVMLNAPNFDKAPKELVLKVAETQPPPAAVPKGQAQLFEAPSEGGNAKEY